MILLFAMQACFFIFICWCLWAACAAAMQFKPWQVFLTDFVLAIIILVCIWFIVELGGLYG